ncbi:GspH/FimT family pseudopilin [Pseudomarimonas salicorniae]|uniref:Type II secretion system protein H n=1 Tax=Pseudomarimonas salicorniae TaxID=2933270 RepID=A0ABT0GFB2_9GAMM|nr:GspH/FimT family pseudopilin [Lysobacter sp. CAU 1642]MCK7593230.1 GspH/FimT family pseudopilin [Lysobacter sp. CAU 1642]
MRTSRPQGPSAGFTLIELLVTVVIASILLIVGVPTFADAFERNRIVSQTNDVSAAFAFARSEALRSNDQVRICPSNAAQNACAADWSQGWLVWRDDDDDDGLDANEILRVGRLDSRDSFAVVDAADVAVTDIRFGPRGGRAVPATAVTLTLKPDSCDTGKQLVRRWQLLASGAMSNVCIVCGTEADAPPTLCD